MGIATALAAYFGSPPRGGVLNTTPTQAQVVGLSVGAAAALAGGILLFALAMQKGR